MEIELPFHRKYRPKRFSEYIGNTKIKTTAISFLKDINKPQVVLMSGPAGSGKTTMARLLAKEYSCENRDPVVGACGKCNNCLDMDTFIETGDAGNLTSTQEIDVTDSNKRQDIDNLLEDASTPSFYGEWKIYILDECHMMTVTAQNRLLKNLEEPAEKVLMILCTTDPQKLLETIRSRCQYSLEVQKPNRTELSSLLERVCVTEGVKYEPRAFSIICTSGDYVPRKTLVDLEKVVREKTDVTYENASEILNVIIDNFFFKFYELLLNSTVDINSYITFLGELRSQMKFDHFIASLSSFTLRGIYVMAGAYVEGLDSSEINHYKKLFKKFSQQDIALILSRLDDMKGDKDVELKLFMLGYQGLRFENVTNSPVMALPEVNLVDSEITASEERNHGNKMKRLATEATPEQEKEFVDNWVKPIGANDLATLFGGGIKSVD